MLAEVALSSGSALPVEVGDAEFLPADANRGDVASKPGANFSIRGGSQQRVFFRRPRPAMRETDGAAEPAPAVPHGQQRNSEPHGQFSVGHRAEQRIFFGGPMVQLG